MRKSALTLTGVNMYESRLLQRSCRVEAERRRVNASTLQQKLLQIIATACIVAAAATARCADITVFAAASLTDSLKQIAADYQKQTGRTVTFNFEASSILARQIEEGAPADIFFSADETQMDRLAERGLIDPATRLDRLGNTLVVVAPESSQLEMHSAADLAADSVKQIALADPKAVPAGVYAKEWLKKFGIWDAVAPKVVPAENVRAALAAVASGNAEAGVVFKTDAAISKHVKIVYEVPRGDSPDIRYPMALVKASEHLDEAKRFLEYMNSEDAAHVFAQFGFVVRK